MTTLKIGTVLLMVSMAVAGVACGDDETGGSGGGGGGGTTDTSVNGCTADAAEDHTGGDATIDFGTSGVSATPECVRITAGSSVTFNSSSFSSHPLVGGNGETSTPDGSSPISADTGTSATITFPDKGTFGFYCSIHGSSMMGAVFVE